MSVEAGYLRVCNKRYPILDGVIILLDPKNYPESVRGRLAGTEADATAVASSGSGKFAKDIQLSFGAEWTRYPKIRQEYEVAFYKYFDLPDLKDSRICDLGCGIGRWSYFLLKHARPRELVLVDFSEAIFVARRNLSGMDNTLFFMADIQRLPFRDDFADFLFSLGVLHHLPKNALEIVRELRKYSQRLLIYLYYGLTPCSWTV